MSAIKIFDKTVEIPDELIQTTNYYPKTYTNQIELKCCFTCKHVGNYDDDGMNCLHKHNHTERVEPIGICDLYELV